MHTIFILLFYITGNTIIHFETNNSISSCQQHNLLGDIYFFSSLNIRGGLLISILLKVGHS